MDHRLIDSCGLVVMIGDLFQLYIYYKYGTAYPQELADFETVLKKDLAKAGNEKRFAKDKKFWDDQLDALGEPLYSDIQGPPYWRKQENVMEIQNFVLLTLR